jgi:competence protein ComEC
VGQGDSIFIELPNNDTMLIDAGEKKYSKDVVDYIKNLGYKSISYVIGTHPHSDHIGGLGDVIEEFQIDNVYMPKVSTNTKTFENLLLTIKNKGLKITTAKKDLKIVDENELTVTVLSPTKDEYSNLNNYSVVLLLKYKNKSFLFMGDAEKEVENDLVGDINCDVLKVGHHGSSSSTSETFLKKTSPSYAVISCGKGNDYGHPHKETLEKLKNFEIDYSTTETCGNILVICDGNEIEIFKDKNDKTDIVVSNDEETNVSDYVLNTSTKKIHYPDCRAVSKISDKNKKESSNSISELENDGYTKCGICKPE